MSDTAGERLKSADCFELSTDFDVSVELLLGCVSRCGCIVPRCLMQTFSSYSMSCTSSLLLADYQLSAIACALALIAS